MKSGIEHVHITERGELERIIEMVLEEFEDVLALAGQEWRTIAQITKIVLYGSHARGDWVDDHHTRVGKHSDWDLIIMVNDERLTDRIKFWGQVTERLHREYRYTHRLRSPAHFFVYTMEQINASLESGRYFFADILRDGILVYEKDDAEFAVPKELPARRVYEMSSDYYKDWFGSAVEFFEVYEFAIGKDHIKNAAFQLHQSVERLYHTVLLVHSLYTPHSHNIVEMREAAESKDDSLVEAWPRDNEDDLVAFEKLQQAYVKGRYRKDFHISEAQLAWLGQRTRILIERVEASCKAKLEALKAAASN